MPSPFPGMDPFLEHPAIFPGLHDQMVANLSESLQEKLPAPYYAEIARRAWVPAPHDEVRETLVEIRIPRDGGECLVTSFEVLSPSNKTPGEHGRGLYLRKQREILDSEAHLVEIDLLRGGTHATAVPRDLAVGVAGSFDYHVSIHRFDRFEDFFVYPIRLEERLPEIAVPLLPGDPDVPLDLQAVFDRCYDTGPYRRRVRYDEAALVPALGTEQAQWVAERLAQAGVATG